MKRREVGKKKSSKKLVTVVMPAMIVMILVTALFVVSAIAGIDTFTNDTWNNTNVSPTKMMNATTEIVTVEIPLQAGWNMISTPLVLTDPSVSAFQALSDKIIPGSIYVYEGAYITPTTIEPKKVYWVKTTEATTITISGTLPSNKLLNLSAGWNMIGLPVLYNISVSDFYALSDKIIAGSVYAYDGAYVAPTKLEPTRGYWVKTTEAVQIEIP